MCREMYDNMGNLQSIDGCNMQKSKEGLNCFSIINSLSSEKTVFTWVYGVNGNTPRYEQGDSGFEF